MVKDWSKEIESEMKLQLMVNMDPSVMLKQAFGIVDRIEKLDDEEEEDDSEEDLEGNEHDLNRKTLGSIA